MMRAELATSGPSTSHALVIYELAVAGQTTTAHAVLAVFTDQPGSAVIGRGTLQAGHTYIVRADDQLGFPNAADGDFNTLGYPYAAGQVYSSYFVVAGP